jgi:hypothetical protein
MAAMLTAATPFRQAVLRADAMPLRRQRHTGFELRQFASFQSFPVTSVSSFFR